jgi:peptide subunit release factor 1 (eRF1)
MTQGSSLPDRLRALLEQDGLFVSLYLDTEGASEDAAHELDLRWRGLRESAAQGDALEAALSALDRVVRGAHRRGDGLAAIATGDRVALALSLSAPVPDGVTAGARPHLVPLLEWRQDNPRVGVVLSDRVGAEIHVLGGLGPQVEVSVEGSEFPIQKVKTGGTSEPRFQRRAENNWEGNAREVAGELARIVPAEGLQLLVIAGDVRAIGFLQEHLDTDVETVALEIESRPEVGLKEVADELTEVVAAHAAQATEELLARFREERGQQDMAVEGAEATLAALRMAQVQTLLVGRAPAEERAWFSAAAPGQAAPERATLAGLGLDDLREAALVDVAVSAALVTGASVWVLPALEPEHGPRQGLGALLRFRT